jgi:hypothetical protein
MGTTPTLGLPYPELADPSDGPKGYKDLATAVEAAILGIIPEAGATANDVPVYDGSKYAHGRITTANVAPTAGILKTQLAPLGIVDADVTGPISAAKISGLRIPAVVTPAQFAALSPVDGDEAYLTVDAAAGIIWHLKYRSAAPGRKWEFVGGSALTASVDTKEALPSDGDGSYRALSTFGPYVYAPRDGDYVIEQAAFACMAQQAGSGQPSITRMSPNIGGATYDQYATQITSIGQTQWWQQRRQTLANIPGGALIASYYSHDTIGDGPPATFEFRRLSILPVRIS